MVGLHAPIKVRVTKEIGGKKVSRIIDATVGRLIFNDPIPQDLGYVDRSDSDKQFDLEIAFLVRKKQLGQHHRPLHPCAWHCPYRRGSGPHQGTGLQVLHPAAA